MRWINLCAKLFLGFNILLGSQYCICYYRVLFNLFLQMTKNISNVLSEMWLYVNDSWLCEVIILNLHEKCVFLCCYWLMQCCFLISLKIIVFHVILHVILAFHFKCFSFWVHFYWNFDNNFMCFVFELTFYYTHVVRKPWQRIITVEVYLCWVYRTDQRSMTVLPWWWFYC